MKRGLSCWAVLAVLIWVVSAPNTYGQCCGSECCDCDTACCDVPLECGCEAVCGCGEVACEASCGCGEVGCEASCGYSGASCGCDCRPRGGFFGGAELTLLVAQTGGLGINIPDLNTGNFQVTPEYDAAVSPRFWFGYQGPGGLAFRCRWWFYDQSARGTDLQGAQLPDIDLPIIDLPDQIDFDLSTRLRADALDLEIAETQSWCNWDFVLSGGLRYARVEETYRFGSRDGNISIGRDFEGLGATVALNTLRPIGDKGFALVGGFRASLLYGESDLGISAADIGLDGLGGGATLVAKQHMLENYEIQLGGRWSRDTDYGRLFAQAVGEAQAWELPPVLLGIGDANIGFVGASFAIGIER